MAALTGNKIKDSYLGLLKSIGNGAISSSFVQISDGGGNALPLYLSTSSIKFYNAYTFPSADGTISGQVLSTDASGTLSWVTSSDNQTLQEVLTQGNTTDLEITTSAQFNGDINGALLQKVKAAEVLSKGDVVYISGGTGDNPEVSKANASDSTKMPALGIMKESLNNINDEGECITSGELTGLNLSSSGTIGDFDTGDELFVSSTTAGGLVDTAPTGEANLIQKIGKVIKGGNGGALTVLGAFRTNAVPNLNSAKIFLGNASNQAVSTAISGDATISNTGVIALATVPVTKGGTGATTLTGILLGNGTSAISGIVSAVDGHVLTADGNGGYAFEVASGDVSISGTPTQNQIAIWTDGSTIKGMSALEIDTNDKITLDQDASSYNIGGGNTANVTGNYNTGFGLDNLLSVTTGTRNVAFGYNSLKDLTIGTDNVAIGYLALQDVTEAIKCVAIGSEALSSVTTGHFNVAVGHTAGAYVSTSTRNTLVGYGSGSQLDTAGTPSGGYNTFIGYQAGSNVTTGSKNVVIGSNTNFVDGLNNYIVLSDGDGNLRMYLDNNGQLNLFSEISLRDSSATNNPLMFQIQRATYTASSPYNTNKLIALNSSNISFQTTGSTDALFIEGTTGNVGIGITPTSKLTLLGTSTAASNTPSDAIVDIKGTSTAHLLMGVANVSPYGAWINTDSTTQPLVLMGTGGNVGIGATSPRVQTEIQGLAQATANINDSGNSKGTLQVSDTANALNAGGTILFAAQNDSGTYTPQAAIKSLLQNGGLQGIGDLAFSTRNATSDTTLTERMRISSGGAATFQSASAKSLTGSFNVSINDSTAFAQGVGGGITLGGYKGATAQEFFAAIDGYKENGTSGNAAGAFRVLTQPSDGSGLAERLRISSTGAATFSGDVKIGDSTTDITSKLTVSGNSSVNTATFMYDGNAGTYFDIDTEAANGSVILRADARSGNFPPMLFKTGGSTRLTISSGGDVAIGSSASKGFLNSTGTAFEFDVNRNPNTGVFGDTNKSHARIEMNGASGGSSILFKTASANNTTATTKLTISSGGAATFSSSAAIAGGLAVGTGTQFATSIFFASAVLSAGAGTYPLKWNSSTGIVTYDTSSRLVKKNIQDSPYGLPQVLQLQPRKYFRTDDKKEEIGFIADEIQKILPEFVPMVEKSLFTKNEEDIELIPGGVNYEKLTAVLVKAIQEQQTIIEDLKSRIETLEG